MAVIETMTFRLNDGVDEAEFIAADKRVQSDFAYQQPGIVRRTTARGIGEQAGDWIVVDLWWDAASAGACARKWDADPVAQEFMAFVDRSTVAVRRYEDRDE